MNFITLFRTLAKWIRTKLDPKGRSQKAKVGILAYGSLITDPGAEISPKIVMRIKAQTPFPVEYGRLSQTRGGAPTLVPHSQGAPVAGEILVMDASVSADDARDMLWRRERRKTGSGAPLPAFPTQGRAPAARIPSTRGGVCL